MNVFEGEPVHNNHQHSTIECLAVKWSALRLRPTITQVACADYFMTNVFISFKMKILGKTAQVSDAVSPFTLILRFHNVDSYFEEMGVMLSP